MSAWRISTASRVPVSVLTPSTTRRWKRNIIMPRLVAELAEKTDYRKRREDIIAFNRQSRVISKELR